jgi:hypothetical protein
MCCKQSVNVQINSTFLDGRWMNVTLVNAVGELDAGNTVYTQSFVMRGALIQTCHVIIDAIDGIAVDNASRIDASGCITDGSQTPAGAGAAHGGNGGAGGAAMSMPSVPPDALLQDIFAPAVRFA